MMISRVGPRRPISNRRPACAERASQKGAGGAAFTLLELLLALAILITLAATFVVSLAVLRDSGNLPEGALRFETLLTMARAEAAHSGRRLRLSFDGESGQVSILWEADPLGAPGVFSDYSTCMWKEEIPSSQVRVVRCDLSPDSMTWVSESQASTAPAALSALTFYPDGSSDSALIELRDVNAANTDRAMLELDGTNGTVRTQFLSEADAEDYLRQAADEGRITVSHE